MKKFNKDKKQVYIGISADILHESHLNILKKGK
jgi:glycerol-3-phosphate cytidylyltransferase-like family protein